MAEYDTDGRIRPVSLVWPEDGLSYKIDRVLAIKPPGSGKDEDPAAEYICLIGGQRMSLFFDLARLVWWVV